MQDYHDSINAAQELVENVLDERIDPELREELITLQPVLFGNLKLAIDRIEHRSRRPGYASRSAAEAGGLPVVFLPETATDAEIIGAVDDWVTLLEGENYVAACASVDPPPGGVWSAELLRRMIEDDWDDAPKDHRVTLAGVPRSSIIDGRTYIRTQRKDVDRRDEPNDGGELIDIWYDLNIDGVVSDLTATFRLVRTPQGLLLRLYNICVQ